MAFYVGQKVVCVDNRGNPLLAIDAIYTIAGHRNFLNGDPGVLLVEAQHCNGLTPFYPHRFRPVVERKTDISALTEILNNPHKKIRAPNKREREIV